MKFISLVDISSKNVVTVNADSLVLRLEINGTAKETRLKKYHGEILYTLFSRHPKSVGYEEITDLLETCGSIISDETRLHRKISEIRSFLAKFHPSLADIIVNTRGVGYGLQLRFRNLPNMANDNGIKFKNEKINESILIIAALIEDAIHLTAHGKITQSSHGHVMERNAEILQEKSEFSTNAKKRYCNKFACTKRILFFCAFNIYWRN
jgi:DNA-binding winged helix-turn-helix (wHTH) protein